MTSPNLVSRSHSGLDASSTYPGAEFFAARRAVSEAAAAGDVDHLDHAILRLMRSMDALEAAPTGTFQRRAAKASALIESILIECGPASGLAAAMEDLQVLAAA